MKQTVQFRSHVTDASVHLDAIRGIAALWVLFSHSRGLYIAGGLTSLLRETSQPRGQARVLVDQSVAIAHFHFSELMTSRVLASRFAVIAFFVLSGFLVGGSVLKTERNGSFSWRKYLFQRLTRLWTVLIPALLLGALLDGCGMYLLPGAHNIYKISPFIAPVIHRCFTVAAFFSSAFFLQGILTPGFGTNNPLWSLSYEFWFYLFFPFLVVALSRSHSVKKRTYSTALLVVLMAFTGWTISAYFLIWLSGAALALLPLRIPRRLRPAFLSVAIVLVFATMFVDLKLIANRFIAEFVLGLAFAFLLWVLLHAQEVTVRPLYRSSAQALSGMSYTLYLTHYPALVFISAVLMPEWRLWPFTLSSSMKLLVIVAAVFAVSWVMYFCFERNTPRVRHWLAKLQTPVSPHPVTG
jgi:peptidoglycan/LPS O-acetylase OafA/YrhL